MIEENKGSLARNLIFPQVDAILNLFLLFSKSKLNKKVNVKGKNTLSFASFCPVHNNLHLVPHFHYLLHVNHYINTAQQHCRIYIKSVSGSKDVYVI